MAKSRTMSTSEIAKAKGVKPGSVRRWIDRGCPARKRKGQWRLRLDEVEAWMSENGITGDHGGDRHDPPSEFPDAQEAYRQARARRVRAQADKAELELKVQRGELVNREEVVGLVCAVVKQARTELLALPSRLCDRLEGLQSGQIYEEIADEVEATLNRLADGLEGYSE